MALHGSRLRDRLTEGPAMVFLSAADRHTARLALRGAGGVVVELRAGGGADETVSLVRALRGENPEAHLLVDLGAGAPEDLVARLEDAGASGILLRDPAQLGAALAARRSLALFAATGAGDGATERLAALARAGADALVVEGAAGVDEVRRLAAATRRPLGVLAREPLADTGGAVFALDGGACLSAAEAAFAGTSAAFGAAPAATGKPEPPAEPAPAPAPAAEPVLAPGAHGDTAPLSFAQQRLWFLEQLEPGLSVHNIPRVVRLEGALDLAALEASLGDIVRRHEVLRTGFTVVSGEPVQVIVPGVEVPLAIEDTADEAEALARATAIACQPFDLSRPPLLRATVLRLGGGVHWLVLTMHHIVSDAWSIAVFFRELSACYEARIRGAQPVLAPLPLQYADYAAWQRAFMEGPRLSEQADYWREALEGAPHVLELPADRPRGAVPTYSGRKLVTTLPKTLLDRLQATARREGVTLFMTLLAAFDVLLSRLTGREDLLVGTPIAGRNRLETEGLVGFFVNTLVMRADLSGDPTFRELLSRVRDTALAGYAHQDLPFEKLVEMLHPERVLSHNPLFQVMFNFQNVRKVAPSLPGIAAQPVRIERGSSRFDLSLEAAVVPEGLTFGFEYATDLFDESTIARLSSRFRLLLEAAAEDPSRRVSELPIVTDAERRALLVDWNDTDAAEGRDATLPSLFERQAARTPEAPAASCGDERVSYRELNARANRLAHRLQRLGIGPRTLVAVAAERSIPTLVTLLAVQKAGAAYVPLDPAYPIERLAYMLEDSGAELLVAPRSAPNVGARRVLVLDEHAWAGESSTDLPPSATPTDLAYVLYTSGSTGRPKGVAVPQRALVNLLLSMAAEPGIRPSDVLVAVTTLSFDIAALEHFLPLVAGAQVVLASRETASDGAALAALLDSSDATILQATPATFRLLLAAGWRGRPGLRALCGGEALPPDLAAALLSLGVELWNVYGPTETTIWSTVHRVEKVDAVVPIGHPIANTRVYVLDAHGRLAPVGVPGELHIGGLGVADGYWGRPDLTAERFREDPFGPPGSRLYRTGDVARWRPDGTLECLGRLDDQVKVRGFRIEPGEVEAVLARHPSVREAAVAARGDGSGANRLVAWFVPENGNAPSPADLRAHLSASLPEYMVPTDLVSVESLPLTPAGKVDRRSLPDPDRPPEDTFLAPRTRTEAALAEIWRSVLRVPRVGVADHFFDLGGHSLLGMQVFSRIQDALQVSLPLRTLFERPTIAELARAVDDAKGKAA